MATILDPNPSNIATVGNALSAGQCIGMPTETVYGLAANAFDEKAVLKTFAIKERPLFDPLIVHVKPALRSLADLDRERIISLERMSLPERQAAQTLIDAFWPGPLTILFPRGKAICDFVTSGLATVGVRMPAHPAAQALLNQVAFPLSAPSANRFGRVSPTAAQDVEAEFGDKIPFILDGGRCDLGVESTVVQLDETASLTILRPGGVSLEKLEEVLERRVSVTKNNPVDTSASPGLLENHYAPSIPLVFADSLQTARIFADKESFASGLSVATISMCSSKKINGDFSSICDLSLSDTGDDFDAARHLFGTMRKAEDSGAQLIVCERPGQMGGLWAAIADRLQKASYKGNVTSLINQITSKNQSET